MSHEWQNGKDFLGFEIQLWQNNKCIDIIDRVTDYVDALDIMDTSLDNANIEEIGIIYEKRIYGLDNDNPSNLLASRKFKIEIHEKTLERYQS